MLEVQEAPLGEGQSSEVWSESALRHDGNYCISSNISNTLKAELCNVLLEASNFILGVVMVYGSRLGAFFTRHLSKTKRHPQRCWNPVPWCLNHALGVMIDGARFRLTGVTSRRAVSSLCCMSFGR